nr:hypothetical protein GCM10020093_070010 [Planobispora longispora]
MELPGLGTELRENPADPVRLAGYMDATTATYVRDAAGTGFRKVDELYQPVQSPDGVWTAMISWSKFSDVETDHVRFVRRATGEEFDVEVGRKPLGVVAPVWSADSGRLLLTFFDFGGDDDKPTEQGFAIVNPATRTATEIKLGKGPDIGSFAWAPGGQEVARVAAPDPRSPETLHALWYSLSGQLTRRSAEEIGPAFTRGDWFSPPAAGSSPSAWASPRACASTTRAPATVSRSSPPGRPRTWPSRWRGSARTI